MPRTGLHPAAIDGHAVHGTSVAPRRSRKEDVMSLQASQRRLPASVWLSAMVVLGGGAWHEVVTAMAAQQRAISLDAERAALMQKHFGQALLIKDGVIRGDLATVTQAATTLVQLQPP